MLVCIAGCVVLFASFFVFAETEDNRATAPSVTFEENASGNFVMRIFSADNLLLSEDELIYPGIPLIPSPEPALVSEVSEEKTENASGDFLSTENIFDTVSVDLKVNGQDGPIEVEKRARIVLSWISEGATRCRGVWSKNDLKLSGTAAGRITRPVTIKIACIDGEGNRADDEVRVNTI